MAGIKRFEDIEAWQKARRLVQAIYALTEDGAFSKDYFLRDQVRRAAVSMTSNIAEGFARRGSKEFANFLSMTHGSAAELQSHLYVARDRRYLAAEEFQKLYDGAAEVSRMVQALMKYLRSNSQLSTRNSELKERI